MAQTTTRPAQNQAAPPQNAVAVLQPPRLAYLPALKEQYGIDEAGWRTLVEAVFPAAKTVGAIQLALDYCKHRKLDIFKRPVHVVPIYDSKLKREVETVWPGIADHRTTAMRTGNYAGMDMPSFGPTLTEKFQGKVKQYNDHGDTSVRDEEVEVAFPEWCQITLYRLLQGNRVPFPGPKVYWKEFYQRRSRFTTLPNDGWAKRPSQMLEKCAEAGALRRAFPEELGDDWTAEEAGAFQNHAPLDVTDDGSATTAPPEPRRQDYVEPGTQQKSAQQQADAPKDQPPAEQAQGQPAAAGDGQPDSKVTDVPDENDKESWPERAKPGEKLEFTRFGKVAEFCEFAEPFLTRTNREGAMQFEAMYDGTLIAMERGKKGSQEAAAEIRAKLKELIGEREPGQEG